MFGLKEQHIKTIKTCFSKYSKIEKVLLYGSRAKGNYKNGSDIDLTIVESGMSFSDLLKLENELDDLLLPYKIDLSLKRNINNPELLTHIERVGKIFYEGINQTILNEPPSKYHINKDNQSQ